MTTSTLGFLTLYIPRPSAKPQRYLGAGLPMRRVLLVLCRSAYKLLAAAKDMYDTKLCPLLDSAQTIQTLHTAVAAKESTMTDLTTTVAALLEAARISADLKVEPYQTKIQLHRASKVAQRDLKAIRTAHSKLQKEHKALDRTATSTAATFKIRLVHAEKETMAAKGLAAAALATLVGRRHEHEMAMAAADSAAKYVPIQLFQSKRVLAACAQEATTAQNALRDVIAERDALAASNEQLALQLRAATTRVAALDAASTAASERDKVQMATAVALPAIGTDQVDDLVTSFFDMVVISTFVASSLRTDPVQRILLCLYVLCVVVVGIPLVLLPVLVCLKADGVFTASWAATLTPLWITDFVLLILVDVITDPSPPESPTTPLHATTSDDATVVLDATTEVSSSREADEEAAAPTDDAASSKNATAPDVSTEVVASASGDVAVGASNDNSDAAAKPFLSKYCS
ncbi:hypothetical protein SPRG_10917 [Saprolegnia parasitica CBS 223.65]|uniref:Uncharacterized protein n=1 Tax=Saprolegnia parasitica (strain CBS 223.65) TaxID=695850 RepID=A0A067C028_SAPPC|nr:hypothetical protein SPRG_10917 [Saprolegnia parasitica CBS 223.65]KDO24129.1 hypothetical protein SPRG_10917 [Saprolegnia parasitica CBS 223.65]|eukprot:XP_012205264.1 hypothetical protein SPRG_10917 [Saprolegnia parasitica CBS 223.65]